jgi:hypothetical protein
MSELNVNKGYTPGNCRWANAKQQRQNQRPVKRRRRAELGAIHQYARSLAAAGSNGQRRSSNDHSQEEKNHHA